MKKNLLSLLVALPALCFAQVRELPRSTPEKEGIRSSDLIATFDSLMMLPKTDIHSVLVMRHGKVIAEMYPAPFSEESAHTLYSCSKTFVGAAVGIAIGENRLRLDDRIVTLLPEFLPEDISDNLSSITVRNLLTMTSGIKVDWNMRNVCADWIKSYLRKDVIVPGTKFEYDSICTYLLSAIVQKVTGKTLLDYLNEKIFTPLHISEVDWELSPEGFNTGGWGLRLQTESLAKFGQLLLNKGRWNGSQLIPEEWVRQMTSRQFEAGEEDYCYQMWECDYPGAVRLDGAYGQYVIIVPKSEMVIVVTECTRINGENQRHIIWNNLLDHAGNSELKMSSDYSLLQKKQETYSLPLVSGKVKHANERLILGRTIVLPENKYDWASIRLTGKPNDMTLEVIDLTGQISNIPVGHGQWKKGTVNAYPPYSVEAVGRYNGLKGPFSVAGSYGWSEGNLTVKIHYTSWVSAVQLEIRDISSENVSVILTDNYSDDRTSLQCKLR